MRARLSPGSPSQRIFREVQFPAHEPFHERRFPLEDLFPASLPHQFAGLARPEFFRAVNRLSIHPPVLFETANAAALCKTLRRFENTFLDQVRFDVFGHGKERLAISPLCSMEKLEPPPTSEAGGPSHYGKLEPPRTSEARRAVALKPGVKRQRNSGSACGRAERAPEQGRRNGRRWVVGRDSVSVTPQTGGSVRRGSDPGVRCASLRAVIRRASGAVSF